MVTLVPTSGSNINIMSGKTKVGKIKVKSSPDIDTILIDYIQINKRHQRKGYGRKALIQFMQDFRAYYHVCTTTISKSNKASIRLFKGAGFELSPSGKQLRACRLL